MFKNNIEDEADFCEAYKSQILNNDEDEKESPLGSIIMILVLLALIIGLSIFGYKYIMDNKNSEERVSSIEGMDDEDLKVTEELVVSTPIKKDLNTEEMKKAVVKSFNELPKSKSVDIDDLADKIKINISENEEENSLNKKVEETIPPVSNSVKSTYIEDLAKLTAEIDKERE